MTTTYDPVSERLEEIIQRAQALRREHTLVGDRDADLQMRRAAEFIISNAIRTADVAPIDNPLEGEVVSMNVVTLGTYRKALARPLRDVVTAFELAVVDVDRKTDQLRLTGYDTDVPALARFATSVATQSISAVEYHWLLDQRQGRVDLLTAYRVKREWLKQLTMRVRRHVRSTARAQFSDTLPTSAITLRRNWMLNRSE